MRKHGAAKSLNEPKTKRKMTGATGTHDDTQRQHESAPYPRHGDLNASRVCVPQDQVANMQNLEYAKETFCVYQYEEKGAVSATLVANASLRTWQCPAIVDPRPSMARRPQNCIPKTGFRARPRVAWAFSGTARSFALTAASLRHHMIDPFEGDSSVIMHLALRDDGGKNQDRYRDLMSLHAEIGNLVPAFNLLRPRMLALRERPAVCNSDCSCKSRPSDFLSLNFDRVLDQFNGWARTWNMMIQLESMDRQLFDVVVRARFDMFWLAPLPAYCHFDAAKFYVALHNGDMFFMASRKNAKKRFLAIHQYHVCRGELQHCRQSQLPALHAWLGSATPALNQKMSLPFAIHRGSACQRDSKSQCSEINNLRSLGWSPERCMEALYGNISLWRCDKLQR